MHRTHLIIAGYLFTFLMLLSSREASAVNAILTDASNTDHWNISNKGLTAIFRHDKDQAETAVLLLKKSATVGQTITILTDGKFIVLSKSNGAEPHITLEVPQGADAATTTIELTGGDEPTIFVNGKEDVKQQGKWIEVLAAADPTLRLEIGSANSARVKFPSPVNAGAVPVAAPAVVKIPAAGKELLHSVSARQMQLALTRFDDALGKKCTRCNGMGNLATQIPDGYDRVGTMTYPRYRAGQEKCLKCNRTGIERATDEEINKDAGVLIKDVAYVNPDDAAKQDTLSKVYTEITNKMIGDQKNWTCLMRSGKATLAMLSPTAGSAVISLVEVKESIKVDDNHRRFLVRVVGNDEELYVDDPVLADELKSGHALMGGLIDKPLANASGDHIKTLTGGFLVAPTIEKDWVWWYKDYK